MSYEQEMEEAVAAFRTLLCEQLARTKRMESAASPKEYTKNTPVRTALKRL